MVPLIISLDSKRALDPQVAGGKGASLAWLRRQGFSAPPGFVLTTAAFRIALAGLPSEGEAADLLLAPQAMPPAVARVIRKAYRRLGGRVAVRSSMVGEDSATASYAGQLDTTLDVAGEEAVLNAVQACWASAFSARMARYAAERQGRIEARDLPALAVVVQRMVQAVSAGVAFSADPNSGQQDALIEAVHGLGDRLVQGQVRPDHFRVDARGVLTEVAPVDPGAPALDPDQVLALARLVRQVARRRGRPQDVEWAWDGAGFQLLQARPITSLAGLHVYSNRMVSDMAPGLVKPLVYSILTVGIARWVFGRIFTDLIGPTDFDFARLVPRIRSRVYADMTLMGELLERVGLPPNFMEMMARDEKSAPQRSRMGMGSLPALLRLVRYGWRHSRLAGELRTYLDRQLPDLASFRAADWSGAAAPDLIAALDRLIAAHADLSWHNFMAQINMMGRNRMASHWLARAAPDANPDDLVRGLVGLKALEPNAALRELARQGQALGPERLGRLQGAADETERRAVLAETSAGQALLAGVEKFIATYGHLSTNSSDFSETPWSENPALIWQAIMRTAEQSPDSLLPGPDPAEAREAARLAVRRRLGFLKQQFFDRLLSSQMAYIDLRERVSDAASQSTYQMRRIVMALAEILVGRGDLAEPNQIFYLTYDEVRDLVAGELSGAEAQARAAAQRAQMADDARVDLPPIIAGDRVPAKPVQLAEGVEYLAGIGGSAGRAQGYARVVLKPIDAPADLGPTDILVVPFTDVGWTPLFPGIGGIVAETGGRLSHTSIVAREYGLPAVVSVHQATRLLRNGQPITVDGDAGRVYLRHTLAN